MDDDWDDAVLREQVHMLMQQRQAARRSANALGLGGGDIDMRSAAPAEATASSVALAAVARGAHGRRLAHAGTGQATRGGFSPAGPH